jgi:hypothetical protein
MGLAQRPDARQQVVSDGSESGRTPRLWLAFAVISMAAAIAYAPSFAVPFQFDDEARLLHNVAMQEGGSLGNALRWLGNSRIVPSMTFVLNYRLGGLEPIGYHIGNFAVHLLTTLGVFALALTLCETPRLRAAWPPRRALWLASAAGLVFACHPLQTQAVTYIIQRYASMAALFYVWAVVCFLRARLRQRRVVPGRRCLPAGHRGAGGVCGAVEGARGQPPAALLLGEWVGFGRPRRGRVLAAGGLAALAILAIPVAWKALTWQPAMKSVSARDIPLSTRVLDPIFAPRHSLLGDARPGPVAYLFTQATVLPRYLGLVVLPSGMNVDHDVRFAQGASPSVLAGFAFLAGLAVFGLWLLPRQPLAAFGILWFFVTLSVESSVLPIDDAMMEHRMYLPMAGLAVSAGWLFVAAVGLAPRVGLGAGAALAGILVALTFARNVVWLSPVTLWLDAADKSPNKARAHANLGAEYHKADRLNDALVEHCRALELAPDDPVANDNLDLTLTLLGAYDSVVPEVVERRPDGSVVLALPAPLTFCPSR